MSELEELQAKYDQLLLEYKALEEQRNELYQEHMALLGRQSAAGRAQIDRIRDHDRKQHAEEIAALKAQHAQELAGIQPGRPTGL